jgi:hypothetical protein
MDIDKASNNPKSKSVTAASCLVGHFSHSPLTEWKIKAPQTSIQIKGLDDKPPKLMQYVMARRKNSVHEMFACLVKLRFAIRSTKLPVNNFCQ